jgi:hypothetical protein
MTLAGYNLYTSEAFTILSIFNSMQVGMCFLRPAYKQAAYALQRQNAENLKQIFPEKEYRGLSPNFHIHVSVSELYIPTIGLPDVLLEEICRHPGNI